MKRPAPRRRIALAVVLGVAVTLAAASLWSPSAERDTAAAPVRELFVDPKRGNDRQKGTARRPLKSIAAALARLPEPLETDVTIHLAAGVYDRPGPTRQNAPLDLAHRMRPRVRVTFVGHADKKGRRPTFGWHSMPLIEAREGQWRFEAVQVGTFSTKQRRGLHVFGPAHVALRDVRFRMRSHSGAGIRAERGGRVSLFGAIELNEHLHDEAGAETFCGIISVDHGKVKFEERKGARLSIGNGSLSAGYYGVIRLGCETARITSWGRQSNNFAVNNSGRIDVHGTETILVAKVEENTPIGPEHDGHILAEDAKITIRGKNKTAISLQKSSTFTCNDIALDGEFPTTLRAMSGSMFTGRFLTDITDLHASTGAIICVEKLAGTHGRLIAQSGGTVSLPNKLVDTRR